VILPPLVFREYYSLEDKHLFSLFVSDELKKFYEIETNARSRFAIFVSRSAVDEVDITVSGSGWTANFTDFFLAPPDVEAEAEVASASCFFSSSN
jgi:hypothetical protein